MRVTKFKELEAVREELHRQGKGLPPERWRELLEELSAEIEGHLDAVREESDND